MTRLDPRSLLLVLCVTACATEPDDTCLTERKIGLNGVSVNRLAANKLAANGVLGSDLPEVALTTAALGEALDPDVLADDFAQDVLAYAVSCALAPDQSVEITVGGETRTLPGSLGLAPQWGEADGTCDAQCQGWVSACLIARTNFLGESREISLLGDHAGLEPSAAESMQFDLEEATYYGGLFGEDKSMYACVPAGSDGPERTCGADPSSCAIEIVGSCDELCDASGCRDAQGRVHAQTITVNLRSEANACG
jgi:hypothetical protein